MNYTEPETEKIHRGPWLNSHPESRITNYETNNIV